jgi:hypothetical protein
MLYGCSGRQDCSSHCDVQALLMFDRLPREPFTTQNDRPVKRGSRAPGEWNAIRRKAVLASYAETGRSDSRGGAGIASWQHGLAYVQRSEHERPYGMRFTVGSKHRTFQLRIGIASDSIARIALSVSWSVTSRSYVRRCFAIDRRCLPLAAHISFLAASRSPGRPLQSRGSILRCRNLSLPETRACG